MKVVRVQSNEARLKFGAIMDDILRNGNIYLIERYGRPTVAMVPVEDVAERVERLEAKSEKQA